MNYIVDDELLKIQIASMIGDFRGYAIEQDVVNQEVDKIILKSRKPVEEIASGKVNYNWYGDEDSILVGGKYLGQHFKDIAEKNYGKSIKIFIQKVSND